ncbi:MAG: flagellar basal body P-ring formation chaperone FlgA, partial [Campylobacterota bacterium]|nr:flagellar basal body P-ring formation chaperone FlgA [Campylobacterota bacterium]
YQDFSSKFRYIKFIKQSFIDYSKIKNELQKEYMVHYQDIVIEKIEIYPRGYIKSIPKDYSVKIQSKSYLKNRGVLSIKSSKTKKQLFFDYFIDATVNIYIARENIKRKEELSHKNCFQKRVVLEKFRATPIKKISKHLFQSKHNLKKNAIITSRDIKAFNLVKRGSNINVVLQNKNINISFSATALKDGVYGDIIKVKQNNSKIIKVKVIAFNLGEVI